MRFRGGGIGHRAPKEMSQQLFRDNDVGNDDEVTADVEESMADGSAVDESSTGGAAHRTY